MSNFNRVIKILEAKLRQEESYYRSRKEGKMPLRFFEMTKSLIDELERAIEILIKQR